MIVCDCVLIAFFRNALTVRRQKKKKKSVDRTFETEIFAQSAVPMRKDCAIYISKHMMQTHDASPIITLGLLEIKSMQALDFYTLVEVRRCKKSRRLHLTELSTSYL